MDTRQVLSSNSFIHFLSGCNAVCEINLFISAMEIRTNTFVDFLSVFFHAVCNSIYKKGGEMKQKAKEIYHRFVNYEWNDVGEGLEKSILEAIETAIKEGQELPIHNVSQQREQLTAFAEYCDGEHGLFIPSWMIDGYNKSR